MKLYKKIFLIFSFTLVSCADESEMWDYYEKENFRFNKLVDSIEVHDILGVQDFFNQEKSESKEFLNRALLSCASAYTVGKEQDLLYIIECLVHVGADINCQDEYAGDTLLIKFARRRDLDYKFIAGFRSICAPKLKLANKKGEYPAQIIYRSNRAHRERLLKALAA